MLGTGRAGPRDLSDADAGLDERRRRRGRRRRRATRTADADAHQHAGPPVTGTADAHGDPDAHARRATAVDADADRVADPDRHVDAGLQPRVRHVDPSGRRASAGLRRRRHLRAPAPPSASLPGTYVAWLSTGTAPRSSAPRQRAQASFASTASPSPTPSRTSSPHKIFNPLRLNESGVDVTSTSSPTASTLTVWTGTTKDGIARRCRRCTDWTVHVRQRSHAAASPAVRSSWTERSNAGCGTSRRLYCFQTDHTGGQPRADADQRQDRVRLEQELRAGSRRRASPAPTRSVRPTPRARAWRGPTRRCSPPRRRARRHASRWRRSTFVRTAFRSRPARRSPRAARSTAASGSAPTAATCRRPATSPTRVRRALARRARCTRLRRLDRYRFDERGAIGADTFADSTWWNLASNGTCTTTLAVYCLQQ